LDPYVPGEQPQDQKYIKLNTNESPFPPSEFVQQAIRECVSDTLRLYPDPEARELKETIAAYYGVEKAQVFVGNGSDEVLAFSFIAFYKNGQKIAFPDITYNFYRVYCSLFDIEYQCPALTDHYAIDINDYPSGLGGIIFPNPNAPTGIFMSLAEIETLLSRHPDIVVIVDEAYVDFGGESCISLISQYPNLLVIQTLSKSRSLAGLRVGFAVGDENLIQGLNCVKNSFNSYPLDHLAIRGAIAAFQDQPYFEICCAEIIRNRDWLTAELQSRSYYVLPSTSNFLLAKHPVVDGGTLYAQLKNKGVLVRYFDSVRIKDFVRITIGTISEMQQLVETLDCL
jgi:histidinol-phosphate aminotransferase